MSNHSPDKGNDLQRSIAGCVETILDEALEYSDTLIELLILDGCRFTRCGDHFYLVYPEGIIDPYVDSDMLEILDRYNFGWMPANVFAIIWDFALGSIEEMAMDIQALIAEAGLDPFVWLPNCPTVEHEKTLIRRMYADLGQDFFKVQPEYREDYEEYIHPYANQDCKLATVAN